jgi:CheY-like chemotaxis protein
MSHELTLLKILVVSEAASERALVRRAAVHASVPIEVTEVEAAADASAARQSLASEAFDVVFFDSRMPKNERLLVLDAIRTAPSRPLAILIGAAEMKTREVLTDGLEVDGLLAKPIEPTEVTELVGNCIRARVPSRVLIVDDSSTVRAIVRKVLQASRFRLNAEEASEGNAAIERVETQRFDIVFLDCHMPGIDGFATLGKLRRAQPDIKVVMITGTRDMRIEDRAHAEGARDFLYKPFFAKDIDAALNRLFGLMRPRWN